MWLGWLFMMAVFVVLGWFYWVWVLAWAFMMTGFEIGVGRF